MAIYVFSLLVGYVPSGVDYALGMRYGYLKDLQQPVKYVFTQVPTERYVRRYEQMGIHTADMLSAHLSMSGECHVGVAPHIVEKAYYNNGHLEIKEYYSDRLLYTDYYVPVETTGGRKDVPVKRCFRKQDGTVAYDVIIHESGEETYLFPNGERLTRYEFICRFIQQLNLSKEDTVIIDRPCYMDFVEPLFLHCNQAKIMIFLHSSHYAERGETDDFLYINNEYYYWFKYANLIDTMIVSTERQKRELIEKLREYGCHVPKVAVIPVSGLDRLQYPVTSRKPYSIMTASRLVPRKKIDWMIQSVVEAHKVNPMITLDIYGKSDEEDTLVLKRLVAENEAESYIHFMGHCDRMADIYTQYEAYITTSMWETYGLSLLEAVGAGNAVIGLNVKYGNELFIQDGYNGYLLDYDFRQIENEVYLESLMHRIAQSIVQLFSDSERLATFQANSYGIASKYLNSVVGDKWVQLFQE